MIINQDRGSASALRLPLLEISDAQAGRRLTCNPASKLLSGNRSAKVSSDQVQCRQRKYTCSLTKIIVRLDKICSWKLSHFQYDVFMTVDLRPYVHAREDHLALFRYTSRAPIAINRNPGLIVSTRWLFEASLE